jgi:hypothetical protein
MSFSFGENLMGSFAKTAGGVAAVALAGAAAAIASPTAARAQVLVPCSSGGTGLQAAVAAANTAGSGTLILQSNCTYSLTTAAGSGTRGPDGLIIRADITIIGGRSTRIVRASTAPAFRVFEVTMGSRLTLESLFVQGGDAGSRPGGGLLNARGVVRTNHVTFANNSAGTGAALANDSGDVTLDATLLDNNATTGTAPFGNGGAIYNDGRLGMFGSIAELNTASGKGGAIYNEQGGSADVRQSTLRNNTATGNGGGLYNGTGGSAVLMRTLVTGNTAADGGGIYDVPGSGTVRLLGSLVTANTPNDCRPTGAVAGCAG